ncbi:hypothetical protein M408DRAFT_187072 [Serendipita vermifera MAFF 305830]|uniref:Dihydroxyacetone kinase n=1 Tax=Serendipita vermifera MAFF 305830 TaxID=933852 RepID=A0A0C3B7K6_SERVB|nr:hypothetical protein M408DRAFT_187072 [Serendipita vermifera MAFF 305830]
MSVTGKHFVNDPATLVQDSLRALELLNPDVKVNVKHKVVYRSKQPENQVALISGGGSGHEPAHSGFVGDGMLTAAVCGNIFASPNPGQVQRALELVDNPQGTVIIVKNYTGDILNFGLAKERYSASHPDRAPLIRFVVVADDVAVGRTQGAIVGRRGLAGTVLVYKIASSLARQGGSLDQVEGLAKCITDRVGTVGIGLGHCHVPGTKEESTLKADEYEIGMGIHNEPGHKRSSPIPKLDKIVEDMVDMLTNTNDPERSFLRFHHDKKDHVVLMVNNLGGTGELEMGAISAAAILELQRRGFTVDRVLVGTFMTSLNMPGVSLTLLMLPRPTEESPYTSDEILTFLDDKSNILAWKMAVKLTPPHKKEADDEDDPKGAGEASETTANRRVTISDPQLFVRCVQAACEALKVAEPDITRMDSVGGDGDCGITLRNGADGVLKMISDGRITGANLIKDVGAIAEAVGDRMDGTSGALYSIFFSALAQALYDIAGDNGVEGDRKVGADALSFALDRLYTYTRARPPSRTLIDPLDAFVGVLKGGGSWGEASAIAKEAAERTKNLPAKADRAAYVEQTNLVDVCDPGAWGVKTILEAACSTLQA